MRLIILTIGGFPLLLLGFALAPTASAQEYLLTSKPSKCISLSKRLVCYQDIQIQWQTPETGNYCLIQLDPNRELQCWKQQRKGQFRFEFAEKQSQTYVLRRQNERENIASIRIDVKWVYKSKPRGRRSWRLF